MEDYCVCADMETMENNACSAEECHHNVDWFFDKIGAAD